MNEKYNLFIMKMRCVHFIRTGIHNLQFRKSSLYYNIAIDERDTYNPNELVDFGLTLIPLTLIHELKSLIHFLFVNIFPIYIDHSLDCDYISNCYIDITKHKSHNYIQRILIHLTKLFYFNGKKKKTNSNRKKNCKN